MTPLGVTEAVLFDLDDVLVPFQTPRAWQWAWRPQGPILGERHVRAMIRRSLRNWDRRRWHGAIGKEPPTDLPALRAHLAETLWAISGHPLPAEETEAVVRRFLRPQEEIERYPDVPGALERLRARGIAVGVVTPLPLESARWIVRRGGIPETLLLRTGDDPGPSVPAAAAFGATVEHASPLAGPGRVRRGSVLERCAGGPPCRTAGRAPRPPRGVAERAGHSPDQPRYARSRARSPSSGTPRKNPPLG